MHFSEKRTKSALEGTILFNEPNKIRGVPLEQSGEPSPM